MNKRIRAAFNASGLRPIEWAARMQVKRMQAWRWVNGMATPHVAFVERAERIAALAAKGD